MAVSGDFQHCGELIDNVASLFEVFGEALTAKRCDSADAGGNAFFFCDFESAYNACSVNVSAAAEFLAECLD